MFLWFEFRPSAETSVASLRDFQGVFVQLGSELWSESRSKGFSVLVLLLEPYIEAFLCSHSFPLRFEDLLAFSIGVDTVALGSLSFFDPLDDLLDLWVYRISLPVGHFLELLDRRSLSSDHAAGTLD